MSQERPLTDIEQRLFDFATRYYKTQILAPDVNRHFAAAPNCNSPGFLTDGEYKWLGSDGRALVWSICQSIARDARSWRSALVSDLENNGYRVDGCDEAIDEKVCDYLRRAIGNLDAFPTARSLFQRAPGTDERHPVSPNFANTLEGFIEEKEHWEKTPLRTAADLDKALREIKITGGDV